MSRVQALQAPGGTSAHCHSGKQRQCSTVRPAAHRLRGFRVPCARAFRPAQVVACLLVTLGSSALAQSTQFNLGRTPSAREISAWDRSITPDGDGLPEGRGTALEGEAIYGVRCAECHGEHGEGGDAEALVGGHRSLRSPRPLKTVGSYWPYATTVWDYVNRAMPFDRPGMLPPDQVYAVVAYVLFLNGIVQQADELNAENLANVKMVNRDSFVPASSLDPIIEPSRPGSPAE